MVLRAVGAKPTRARGYWIAGRRLVTVRQRCASRGISVAANLYRTTPACMDAAAHSGVRATPGDRSGRSVRPAGANGQVGFVTWVNLAARVASLVLLGLLLHGGVGVEAAFIARVGFQGAIMVAYAAGLADSSLDGTRTPLGSARERRTVRRSARPTELSLRTPTFVLSSCLCLAATGLYDAADRVSQILRYRSSSAPGRVRYCRSSRAVSNTPMSRRTCTSDTHSSTRC